MSWERVCSVSEVPEDTPLGVLAGEPGGPTGPDGPGGTNGAEGDAR